MRRLLPVLDDYRITHRWGGVLGVPRDWFPSVGYDRTARLAWGGVSVDEVEIVELCRATLAREGIDEGELGVVLVRPDEIRALKRDHLAIDEATDVLSFPIDARDELPSGVPRQLGDVVLCPAVVGAEWRWPLVHGLLHLLGYDHGAVMERRERELVG